jgi:hypothetical protein
MSYRKSLISVSLFTVISLLLSASWLGCGGTLGYNEGGGGGGGGASGLTLDSVTDGSGAEVTDGSTGVNPTFFDLVFSADVDDTICLADDVTVSCVFEENTALTPTFTVAVSGTNSKACLVTVTDAWKYALMTCTVTYNSTVSAAISPKATIDESISFTNGCALNDDYNADSRSCYEIAADSNIDGTTVSTWGEIIDSNILAFDPANSTLNYSNTGSLPLSVVIGKAISSVDSDFELMIHVKDASGFSGNDGVGFNLSNNSVNPAELRLIGIGVSSFGTDDISCYVAYIGDAGFKNTSVDCAAQKDDVSVRLIATATSISFQYWDGSEFVDFPAGEGLPTTGAELLTVLGYPDTTIYLGPSFVESGDAPSSAKIDSIEVSGFTVADQY